MKYFIKSICLIAWIIFSPIVYPTRIIPVEAAGVLYVMNGGDDTNTCSDPLAPCATIQGAIGKAAAGDTIKVAVGYYTGTDDKVVLINKNIQLLGGWETDFSSQNGVSTINGQNGHYDVWINDHIIITMEHFILQNGKAGIVNGGDFTASYITVQNHIGDAYSCGGIRNYGKLLLRWSSVTGNKCPYGGEGGGIYNWSLGESLTILNSTISSNENSSGAGIYSENDLIIINSTISNNKADFGRTNSGGGGIAAVGGTTILKNVTISGNDGAQWGGGIAGGNVTLYNSIVANNTADADPDCSATITSAGYNIIGDTTGCVFHNTTGDQVGVNPKLGALRNNGGPTATQWLSQGSPAIDGGNPAGCTDQNDNPLTIDQRGFTRPLDGNSDGNNVCDIGAYEADPENLPPPLPESEWYVTKNGNNNNNCQSPTSACATINGALGKALSGDFIYIATGVYSANTGNEVVLVDKNITLSGGWEATFNTQTSHSTIDGQHFRRVMTINQETKMKMENLIIQNGLTQNTDCAGVSIGYRANVTLSNSYVLANYAGNSDPSYYHASNGGGICVGEIGNLILNGSVVNGNTAVGSGGGIYVGRGTLNLNDSTIGYNTAYQGGGIASGYGAHVLLNHGIVTHNTSTGPYDGGGGISSADDSLTIYDSLITGNVTAGEGGGVYGYSMTISNTTISYNTAQYGGGISNWALAEIRNSAILHNTATNSEGGGIYCKGGLLMVNGTIAYNKAVTGAGIYRDSNNIEVRNTTIIRNDAGSSGGGVWNANTAGLFTLRNSLLAENKAAAGPDCYGPFTSAGYNLIADTTACSIGPATGDLTNVDPRIALQYGNPSTFSLWTDSPAIDGGNPAGCINQQGSPLTVDQVGTTRPLDGNGDGVSVCDVGSFEYDPAHPPQYLFLPFIKR